MHPSSFVTLFVLITTIFAAPLNLTSGIDGEFGISTSSEDPLMPLQRRDLSQTCVYWAVQHNLGEKVENNVEWMHYLKKDFGGFPAVVRKLTAYRVLHFRTIHHMLRNLITIKQLIKVATVQCPPEVAKAMELSSRSSKACTHYYVVTKKMGVPTKALKTQISEPLPDLIKAAINEYKDTFGLIYPPGGGEEDDYFYQTIEGTNKLKASIDGMDWAFALPRGHADPGEPERFT